jgi:large subunit ribosomal protein L31
VQTGIHPTYGDVVFRDKSAGTAFLSRSTLVTRDLPSIAWEDGREYPVVDVDVSAASHPFWTGTARVLDTEGRVEKFRRRYAR